MRTLMLCALGGLFCCAGCSGSVWWQDPSKYSKPTIAVMKFQNRVTAPMGWNISEGLPDILTDKLVGTGRYHVIERPEMAALMRELQIQNSGVTRAESRSEVGRLKNVQYLVKGTITDFGHVNSGSGWLGGGSWDVFGGGTRAVMGMTLYVVDVESGEIVSSRSIEESVGTGNADFTATYKGLGFGGQGFYRTPLGRATKSGIERAVVHITSAIASRAWEPKVAQVDAQNQVVINGGKDRGIKYGQEYEVLDLGTPIIDPDTGDLIGRHPGAPRGRIRVTVVQDRYAAGEIVFGQPSDFRAGQRCRCVQPTTVPK